MNTGIKPDQSTAVLAVDPPLDRLGQLGRVGAGSPVIDPPMRRASILVSDVDTGIDPSSVRNERVITFISMSRSPIGNWPTVASNLHSAGS